MSDTVISRVVDMISAGVPFFKDADGSIWRYDYESQKIYLWSFSTKEWVLWQRYTTAALLAEATMSTDPSVKLIKKWRFAFHSEFDKSAVITSERHYAACDGLFLFGPDCIALPWTETEEPEDSYCPF